VQQILALLLVFHQTHNLARNKFARALANQPIRALHFFDLQQMFLLRIKLIMQSEKRETSTKTCNETMLRDKLMGFCISYFAAFNVDGNTSKTRLFEKDDVTIIIAWISLPRAPANTKADDGCSFIAFSRVVC